MSCIEEIRDVLLEHGPMDTDGLMKYITDKHDTIQSKALILMANNLLSRNEQGEWVLSKEVTKETVLPHDYPGKKGDAGKGGRSEPGGGRGASLDPQPLFESICKGVSLKQDFIPTISQLFFNGDIDDLNWLHQVLTRLSAGFVAKDQARFIEATWAKTRNLPYNPDEFVIDEPEGSKGKKGAGKQEEQAVVPNILDKTGIGWRVGKDQAGDWVPIPGGPMTYQQAFEGAKDMNAIAAVRSGIASPTGEEPGEGDGSKSPARGARPVQDFRDKVLDKVIDKLLDNSVGGNREDSPMLKAMQDQNRELMRTIEQMREDQQREWRERIESNIAAIASRDPWSDPVEIARARQLLGVQTSTITDQSPAVQIFKDSADKLDKTAGRLLGIVERVALQSDQFRPEETRSPAEKEAKAGQILDEAGRRERSKTLRQQAFGV